MTVFDILDLVCGLALFLYGMEVMGDALKKSAGNRLKIILASLTSNPFKGFLLGLGVTTIIQSSSATTVMVVGFVNSGTMLLSQAIWVIIGANLGTAITAWITGLAGIGGSGEVVASYIQWLKPSAWIPILALVGLCLLMFSKRARRKDVGIVLLGFSVLMVGMDMMSASVSGLKESEAVRSLFTLFENPILGILVGLVVTAVIQSSSASVGILQSLTVTGAITFGAAIPIIIGQNIGTCATAMVSSVGANKNGRRAAFVHLFLNIVGAVVFIIPFYILNAIFKFSFMDSAINMWWIAGVHTLFKIYWIIVMIPFVRYIEKIAVMVVKDKGENSETANLLDERLLDTPAVAVERAEEVARKMADISCEAMLSAMKMLYSYDEKEADNIRRLESSADGYEDMIGSYLVKLSNVGSSENENGEVTKLLHLIGDFERISDHAVNFVESLEEINDKKMVFSDIANKELNVLMGAVTEIITLARDCYINNDFKLAERVEPLEEVIDELRDKIKHNHVIRLQKSVCSIEHGFVLSDILTNLERVADHCSNIAGCVIEIAHNALDMHRYTDAVKKGEAFEQVNKEYSLKYSLETRES